MTSKFFMEKLLTDLQLTKGLENVTRMQLNDLKWKTKQLIFMTLLTALPSSGDTSCILLELVEDRRLEKHAEHSKQCSIQAKKVSEKSFQAEFLQRVAKDLDGNWEQLMMNPESCYQAFRILLTRIKSRSQRPSSSSGNRRAMRKPSVVLENRPAWNGIEDDEKEALYLATGPSISIESPIAVDRVKPTKTSTNTDSSMKLEALRQENKRLKDQLRDYTDDKDETFVEHRVRFLKAQNAQLQRQVDLLLDVIETQQSTKVSFQTMIQKLHGLVETGVQEARNAGCDQEEKKNTWMMAIPTGLLSELNALQQQMEQVERSGGRELHAALHAESYTKQEFSTSSTMLDVHGHGDAVVDISPVGHLRFDRILELEGSLAEVSANLLNFSRDAMERCFVPLAIDSGIAPPMELATSSRVLAKSVRQLAMDCSHLGSVVCKQAVGPNPKRRNTAAEELLRVLTPFSGHYRQKEQTIRQLILRITAEHENLQNQVESYQHELELWHRTYAQQYKCIHELVNGVKRLWEKKFSWIQQEMVEPLECFGNVIEYDSVDLLVETFEKHRETLYNCQQQFTTYVDSLHTKLHQIIHRYNTSVQVIEKELKAA